jgi:hypothetical protein
MQTIISHNFIQICNLALLLSHYLKFFGNILDSLEFRKFQTHNSKAMAEDKKVNIAVA